MYDQNGKPFSMRCQIGSQGSYDFYYIFNSQGDIIGLSDSAGNVEVRYEYNSWGEITLCYDSTHAGFAERNPFRYRGYFYDDETGFYYVGSRYYDPKVCRFINADEVDTIAASPMNLTDKNLYAYCDNNPVTRKDTEGEFWNIIAGAAIGAVISAGAEIASQVVDHVITGKKIDWKEAASQVLIATASGAVSGALAATGVGKWGQTIGNAIISGVSEGISQFQQEGSLTGKIKNIAVAAVVGGWGGHYGGDGVRLPGSDYANALKQNVRIREKIKNGGYKNLRTGTHKLGRNLARLARHKRKVTIATAKKFAKAVVVSSGLAKIRSHIPWFYR